MEVNSERHVNSAAFGGAPVLSGIVIVDKVAGMTSHDVVGCIRRIYWEHIGVRPKSGHGGTLDPAATGVLPVFVGRATRAVEYVVGEEKEYTATAKLGVVTDTQDTTGRILSVSNLRPSVESLERVLPLFMGEIDQVPPMYSAVKVGGRKLYEYARSGLVIERAARRISINTLIVTGFDKETFSLRICCSSGTYVRTLCHDIGMALGCGAALSGLRRIRAGRFGITQALTLGDIAARVGRKENVLAPVDCLFLDLPAVTLDAHQTERLLHGEAPVLQNENLSRAYDPHGVFLALLRNGMIEKSFWDVS